MAIDVDRALPSAFTRIQHRILFPFAAADVLPSLVMPPSFSSLLAQGREQEETYIFSASNSVEYKEEEKKIPQYQNTK